MKPVKLLSAALLALPLFSSVSASAQDYDDLDAEASSKGRAKRDAASEDVREIVKGVDAKANVGGAAYLGSFAGFVSPGTSTSLSFGQDFVDRQRSSMAWEVGFFQGIHNGCYYELQAYGACPGAPNQTPPYVQGDIRTYTLAATLEFSGYITRRIGIGLRAGGGILFSPLLMDKEAYTNDVLTRSWGLSADPGYHTSPHPVVMGGPTFEYYTKLSHFSVGADVDAFYGIGFDLGVSFTGAMKYTF